MLLKRVNNCSNNGFIEKSMIKQHACLYQHNPTRFYHYISSCLGSLFIFSLCSCVKLQTTIFRTINVEVTKSEIEDLQLAQGLGMNLWAKNGDENGVRMQGVMFLQVLQAPSFTRLLLALVLDLIMHQMSECWCDGGGGDYVQPRGRERVEKMKWICSEMMRLIL